MDEQLRRTSTADTIVAAANYVKRASRAILASRTGSGESIGSREVIETQRGCLVEWLSRRDRILDPSFFQRLRRRGGGGEHEVFEPGTGGRLVKVTHPNRFGHSVWAEGARATPLQYLQRLFYHNHLLGDDIELVGAIVGDDHMEIVTSQPTIVIDRARALPTPEEVDEYFGKNGFRRSALFPEAGFFYNRRLTQVRQFGRKAKKLSEENRSRVRRGQERGRGAAAM